MPSAVVLSRQNNVLLPWRCRRHLVQPVSPPRGTSVCPHYQHFILLNLVFEENKTRLAFIKHDMLESIIYPDDWTRLEEKGQRSGEDGWCRLLSSDLKYQHGGTCCLCARKH